MYIHIYIYVYLFIYLCVAPISLFVAHPETPRRLKHDTKLTKRGQRQAVNRGHQSCPVDRKRRRIEPWNIGENGEPIVTGAISRDLIVLHMLENGDLKWFDPTNCGLIVDYFSPKGWKVSCRLTAKLVSLEEVKRLYWLVVWNMFYFSHILGIIIPID